MDEDSRLATVDVSNPTVGSDSLILSRYTESLIEEFLGSVRAYDLLQSKGVPVSNRLLIHGPPGTGKTSIARHISAELHLPLVTTRSDTLVSSLLGQTSRNIREVFDYASRMPCVLFLDEFDALAKDRADSHEIGELQRVVIALLQNMDALSEATVLIAATNHAQLLDPAVWRRFAHTVKTDLPGTNERRKLWENRLGQLKISDRDSIRLSTASDGLSAAAIETAAFDIARHEVLSGSEAIRLPHAFRRLARFMWYEDYELFNDESREIKFLRNWAPDVFTIRALADVFGIGTRKISVIVGGDENDRSESDPVVALHSPGVEAKARRREHTRPTGTNNARVSR
jgi:SpoVK/Ycf46/Vps4 family AAA+-type ATPase